MKQIEEKINFNELSSREKDVHNILNFFNSSNKHKMEPGPICIIPDDVNTK